MNQLINIIQTFTLNCQHQRNMHQQNIAKNLQKLPVTSHQSLTLVLVHNFTNTSPKVCNLWSFWCSTVHTAVSYSARLVKHCDDLCNLLS